MKVNVKWNKELLKDIEIDLEQSPAVFKTQLFSLTSVPPDRQKILVKGGVLGDDEWGKGKPKEGQTLMMMGTVGELREPQGDEVKFIEDVVGEEEQQHLDTKQYGAGLENMGNTCYMNSTMQCLYSVKELRERLIQSPPDDLGLGDPAQLSKEVRALFARLSTNGAPYMPLKLWNALKQTFPQFNQVQNGRYMQQDAQECWSQLVTNLKQRVKVGGEGGSSKSYVDQLFQLEFQKTLKSEESGETVTETEGDLMLKCNIEQDVDTLDQGIARGLKADREQMSQALGSTTVFSGSANITRLPPYLTVQLVRFFFKQSSQQKAKILRKVVFPMSLDCYPYCSDDLQQTLNNPRAAKKVLDDRLLQQSDKATTPQTDADGAASMDVDVATNSIDPEDFRGQPTGRYSLQAVLTHKGRSADSGHYVAWVRQDDTTWVEFDDDMVIPRKADDILALSGGGDWHMAYLLLYQEERVPLKDEGKAVEGVDEKAVATTAGVAPMET